MESSTDTVSRERAGVRPMPVKKLLYDGELVAVDFLYRIAN